MGGGKGGGGDTETTVRYAPYIESAHTALITQAQTYGTAVIGNSPFASLSVIDPSTAFFASGYAISSYPSVYDMYGKFLAGLDIEVLWNQVHQDTAYGAVINEIVSTDAALLEDELDAQIAELFAQARNINAVMSSSFIVAEGNMRDTKIKVVAKERADLRGKFTEIGQRRHEGHLNWNTKVIDTYLKMNELFFNTHGNYLQNKATIGSSNLLWPFTVLDHARVIIACLQGATDSKTKGETSGWATAANVIGMAAGAAYIGKSLGLFGTVAAAAPAMLASDIRLKKFITLIKGKYNHLGLNCYRWKWNNMAERLFGLTGNTKGVIAQEVELIYPQAVISENGYLKVNYGLLDKMLMEGG